MRVKDVMSVAPVCCSQRDSVKSVATLMRDHRIGSVLIVDNGALVGIVTDRDLCVRVLAESQEPLASVAGFMSPNPITCRATDDLGSCEALMQMHGIRRIAVTDDKGRCIGIVTQADIAVHETPYNIQRTISSVSRPRRKEIAESAH